MSENSLGIEGYLVRMYLLLGFSGVVMIGIEEYDLYETDNNGIRMKIERMIFVIIVGISEN